MFSNVCIDIPLVFVQLGLENFGKIIKDPPLFTFCTLLLPWICAKNHQKLRVVIQMDYTDNLLGFLFFPRKYSSFSSTTFFWFPPFEILGHWQNFEVCYSQVANRRGGRLLIFQNFLTPPKLIRTPPLINYPEKSFWSGHFCYWLAIFSILSKWKRLFDSYMKQFYQTLFIY